ncbi:NAD(P)/FAD-dependent oxidoreductase [Pararhizobium mangrovi]|uniref:FAD-dependent oxidoreductase n=1 Tax=Pararhizobium mangrovi TaxID=2590452 RepID=A0A506U3D8_9HYPH|nr:FAD-dependent oxidoreductase [Pararhizobium mangrovi]TPW26407.1 FAD-dependent oxidoreductase [Pararhizobium mangrovi]
MSAAPPFARSGGAKRIAVVGSGISGASAAWALRDVHDVTLYESRARPGGHTATVEVDYDGTPIAVDTGFIVYNEANYPNLTALFSHLGVGTHASDMSFSLSIDHGRMEWCGNGLGGLFAQKSNLLRPRFLRMVADVVRFNRQCLADRRSGRLAGKSVGDYLADRRFSKSFAELYLAPMAAAIWSTPSENILDFSAEQLVTFFDNHRLIYARQQDWRTVTGGSRRYLDRLLAPLGSRVKLGRGVLSIRRRDGEVSILDDTGTETVFDRVILATHSDQALGVLEEPTPEERAILSAIPYSANRVVLHRDPAFMPKRRRAWSSWNYHRSHAGPGDAAVSVTYWMNRLQDIDPACPLFVTLNPEREPAEGSVFGEFSYAHPQFAGEAMAVQARLEAIQGLNGTFFAGAWTGYGFHEDGLVSGLAAAEALGGVIPWRIGKDEPEPALPAAAE